MTRTHLGSQNSAITQHLLTPSPAVGHAPLAPQAVRQAAEPDQYPVWPGFMRCFSSLCVCVPNLDHACTSETPKNADLRLR